MRADAEENYNQLLAAARDVVTEQGVQASLRDIARRAEVSHVTLLRHFPTREALVDALLRKSLEELTAKAAKLEASTSPGEALWSWLRDAVGCTEAMSRSRHLHLARSAREAPQSSATKPLPPSTASSTKLRQPRRLRRALLKSMPVDTSERIDVG